MKGARARGERDARPGGDLRGAGGFGGAGLRHAGAHRHNHNDDHHRTGPRSDASGPRQYPAGPAGQAARRFRKSGARDTAARRKSRSARSRRRSSGPTGRARSAVVRQRHHGRLLLLTGTVTINTGDTVTWHNSGQAPHTATANNGSFDTGTINRRQRLPHLQFGRDLQLHLHDPPEHEGHDPSGERGRQRRRRCQLELERDLGVLRGRLAGRRWHLDHPADDRDGRRRVGTGRGGPARERADHAPLGRTRLGLGFLSCS